MAKRQNFRRSGQFNITASPPVPPPPKKAIVHGVLGVEDVHAADWGEAGPSRSRLTNGANEPGAGESMGLRSRYLPRERMDRFYGHKYGGQSNKTLHEEREEREGEE